MYHSTIIANLHKMTILLIIQFFNIIENCLNSWWSIKINWIKGYVLFLAVVANFDRRRRFEWRSHFRPKPTRPRSSPRSGLGGWPRPPSPEPRNSESFLTESRMSKQRRSAAVIVNKKSFFLEGVSNSW